MDDKQIGPALEEVVGKLCSRSEKWDRGPKGVAWTCSFKGLGLDGFLTWETNDAAIGPTTVTIRVHMKDVTRESPSVIINLLAKAGNLINGAFSVYTTVEGTIWVDAVRRIPAQAFNPWLVEVELRDLIRQASSLLNRREAQSADGQAPGGDIQEPDDTCARDSWMDSVPVCCRKCGEAWLLADFATGKPFRCPKCAAEESYNFCAVCPKCKHFTAFHQGSLAGTLIEIAQKGFEGWRNPMGAAVDAVKYAGTLTADAGKRGVCSVCSVAFVACPKCGQLEHEGEATKVNSCSNCAVEFRNP